MKACKHCGAINHYSISCFSAKKKPITKYGNKARAYSEWRDTVAKPHLIAKDGYKCALCGFNKRLDIDHIAKRRMGGAPSRTMDLSKVRFLCRSCHIDIT